MLRGEPEGDDLVFGEPQHASHLGEIIGGVLWRGKTALEVRAQLRQGLRKDRALGVLPGTIGYAKIGKPFGRTRDKIPGQGIAKDALFIEMERHLG